MKTRFVSIKTGWVVWIAIGLAGVSISCQQASLRNPPPMFKLEALAPRAAMLPISSNDSSLADLFSTKLARCLEQRNALDFIPPHQVKRALQEAGIDPNKAYRMKPEQYRAITRSLGIHYTVDGRLTAQTVETSGGQTPLVKVDVHIEDGSGGGPIDSWDVAAQFSPVPTGKASNHDEMAQIAANMMCTDMLESDERPFALREINLFRN